jgi:hypothetical protein
LGGGTGDISIGTTAVNSWKFSGSSPYSFLAATDATSDIGASGANRPRDAFLSRDIYTGNASFMHRTSTALTGGGTGNVPTLTAGPVTGDPTKWIPIDDAGTTRYIPAW